MSISSTAGSENQCIHQQKLGTFPPFDGNLPGHRPNLKMATLISPTESRTKIIEKFGDSPTPKPTSPLLKSNANSILKKIMRGWSHLPSFGTSTKVLNHQI